MPPKKSSGGQKAPPQETTVLPDGGDPALVAMAIVDKKKRNLEKRKNKLEILRDSLESGTTNLDKDQLAAVAKLDEVSLQLELVKELQKQFTTLQTEYQKSRKKQQKLERLQARDSEREAERRAMAYTLKVQDILNNLGEEDKENFKTGVNGAIVLTETELTQLDELYRILTPARQGNPNYQHDLNSASAFIQQIMEQSTKDVLGTSYKQLYELLQRIDESGYFDRSASDNEEDEDSQEEGAPDDDDYKSAEDNLTPSNETDIHDIGGYERTTDTLPAGEEVETSYIPTANVGGVVPGVISSQQEPSPVVQTDMPLSGLVPSAPSPTFPGLGPNPLQPVADDGFSFMHDSEVDRGGIQAVQQTPTTLDNAPSPALLQAAPDPQMTAPSMDYYSPQDEGLRAGGDDQNMTTTALSIKTPDGSIIPYPATNTAPVTTVDQSGTQSDSATTDVATGQPSQSTDTHYQGGVAMSSAGGSMMNSAPPPSAGGVYQHYGSGAVGDTTAGYHQHYGAPVRVGAQPPRGGSGGRGGRRGGGPGGPKGAGGMYRNGRGMQGGYEMQYGGNRGYGSGGGGGNYQRSGRTNYRAGGGPGPRK